MFKRKPSVIFQIHFVKCQNHVEVVKTLLRVGKRDISWMLLVLKEITAYKAIVC